MSGPVAPPRPRTGMDPRIRRRQIEVRRSEGRRRLRVAGGALAAVAVAVGGWGLTRSPLLDVDRVTVEGAAHSGAAAVRAAAAIGDGKAMTDVDGAGVARRVRALPWVLGAEVRRAWPATVEIRVVERRPTALTRDDTGGWAEVDATGRVLAVSPQPDPVLPVVEGLAPARAPGTTLGREAGQALRVATALPDGLASRVASVTRTGAGVELHLRPSGVVLLGGADLLAEKLDAALTVLGAVDGRSVATLDVRIPATPVLTRR